MAQHALVSPGSQTLIGSSSAKKHGFDWGGSVLTVLTYILAFLMFFPVLWTFLTGFKFEANAVSLPPQIFSQFTLENYHRALIDTNYFHYFVNSAILCIGSTILAFVLGIPAAFSLAMYPTKRSDSVLSWVLSTKMMPVVGVIIPLYVIYKQIHLFDTQLGMILLYAALNMPLVIWMMRSFFAELPRELTEAAQIDGAGVLLTIWRVILPVAAPGIAATALICLIFAWDEFLLAVNLTSASSATLPVYIAGFMTSEGLFWAKMSAAATVAIAPVFVAGWTAQRALVRGLTMGAVK